MSAIKIVIVSALITGAALKAVPAFAQTPATASDVSVSIVRTADLDLRSDAGRRQLDQRLTVAAREVCGTASDFDLEGKNQARACRSEVLARAQAQRDQIFASQEPGGTITIAASR